MSKPKGFILRQAKGRAVDASGALGRVLVHGNGGKTSVIIAVHPEEKRILTESGSIYELGSPDSTFAAEHPHIMRELGFSGQL